MPYNGQPPSSLTDLPTEILLHISTFIGESPLSLVRLLPVCKEFYFLYRRLVYRNIYAIISSDDYFFTECSVKDVKNRLRLSNAEATYRGRTLVTSARSLAKLSNLLLSRPDLLFLVHSFHINGLNFDASERKVSNEVMNYMKNAEENESRLNFNKTPHNFFLHKSSLHDLCDSIFETSVADFFQSKETGVNIHKCTEVRRHITSSHELEEFTKKENKELVLMTLNRGVVNMMLFCPHGLDGFMGDVGFVDCLHLSKLVLESGSVGGGISILNFQNMMSQSSFRQAGGDCNDLVFTSLMSYQLVST